VIADRFRRQWRGLAAEERPLPPPGRADSGLVAYGLWRDGLAGVGLERTRELLRSERWRRERTHASVHLTLYLEWADGVLRQREAQRMAGLDLGRAIGRFL